MESLTTYSGLEISFKLIEFEDESVKYSKDGIHLNIFVALKADGFSGHSNFWVRKLDFDYFIEELKKFNQKLSGEAKIKCGWGDTVYFGVEFFPYDKAGHLGARFNVADRITGRSKEENSMNQITLEKELESHEVEKFIKIFECISSGQT